MKYHNKSFFDKYRKNLSKEVKTKVDNDITVKLSIAYPSLTIFTLNANKKLLVR